MHIIRAVRLIPASGGREDFHRSRKRIRPDVIFGFAQQCVPPCIGKRVHLPGPFVRLFGCHGGKARAASDGQGFFKYFRQFLYLPHFRQVFQAKQHRQLRISRVQQSVRRHGNGAGQGLLRRVFLLLRFGKRFFRFRILLLQLFILLPDNLHPGNGKDEENRRRTHHRAACRQADSCLLPAVPVHQVVKPHAQHRGQQAEFFRFQQAVCLPGALRRDICRQRLMFLYRAVGQLFKTDIFRKACHGRSFRQHGENPVSFPGRQIFFYAAADRIITGRIRRADDNQPAFRYFTHRMDAGLFNDVFMNTVSFQLFFQSFRQCGGRRRGNYLKSFLFSHLQSPSPIPYSCLSSSR